jgi:cysteine synthase A
MAHSNAIRDSVLQAIGNTPVVRLRRVVTPSMADVLVKLEYYNLTGSYKDRMALAMIEGAEARGELRPGMRVVEWTGGSTGSSFAMVCAIKGYHFTPISSDGFAKEKLQTMRLFGCGARAGNLARAHHGERRAAPRRGDRRRIPAASPEAR